MKSNRSYRLRTGQMKLSIKANNRLNSFVSKLNESTIEQCEIFLSECNTPNMTWNSLTESSTDLKDESLVLIGEEPQINEFIPNHEYKIGESFKIGENVYRCLTDDDGIVLQCNDCGMKRKSMCSYSICTIEEASDNITRYFKQIK